MILPLLDREKKNVILVMHSYGACPGSAAAKGLGVKERRAEGKETAVIGQICFASILPKEGENVVDHMGGKLPEAITVWVSI